MRARRSDGGRSPMRRCSRASGTERLMVDLRGEAVCRGRAPRIRARVCPATRALEPLAALDATGPWVTRARLGALARPARASSDRDPANRPRRWRRTAGRLDARARLARAHRSRTPRSRSAEGVVAQPRDRPAVGRGGREPAKSCAGWRSRCTTSCPCVWLVNGRSRRTMLGVGTARAPAGSVRSSRRAGSSGRQPRGRRIRRRHCRPAPRRSNDAASSRRARRGCSSCWCPDVLPGFAGHLVSEYFLEIELSDAASDAAGSRNRARATAARPLAARLRVAGSGVDGSNAVRGGGGAARGRAGLRCAVPSRARARVRGRDDPGRSGARRSARGRPGASGWIPSGGSRSPNRFAARPPGRSSSTAPIFALVDAGRLYARRFVEFEIDLALDDERTFAALWSLLHATAFHAGSNDDRARIRSLVERSEQHASGVSRSLRDGVLAASADVLGALLRPAQEADRLAVARRFVRTVADGCLSDAVSAVCRSAGSRAALAPRLPRQLQHRLAARAWPSSRSRRPGCGTRCRPSRGSRTPAAVPAISGSRRSTAVCSRPPARRWPTVGIWTTRRRGARCWRSRRGRRRTAPAASGLRTAISASSNSARSTRRCSTTSRGSIASRPDPCDPHRPARRRPRRRRTSLVSFAGSGVRKATGSFYTPQPLADYLVRRTLGPLVQDAAPDDILRLRVVDPAMGSGAFLVAACRYLADAYETALLRTGGCAAGRLRRGRARRDQAHHRRAMSVRRRRESDGGAAGATVAVAGDARRRPAADVSRSPSSDRRQPARRVALAACGARRVFGRAAGRTTRTHCRCSTRQASPTRSGRRCRFDSAWPSSLATRSSRCGRRSARSPRSMGATRRCRSGSGSRMSGARRGSAGRTASCRRRRLARCRMPFWPAPARCRTRRLASYLEAAAAIARSHRLFHWELEFPEVFFGGDGRRLPDAGFDAVIGNPPWDMVRADAGSSESRAHSRTAASAADSVHA